MDANPSGATGEQDENRSERDAICQDIRLFSPRITCRFIQTLRRVYPQTSLSFEFNELGNRTEQNCNTVAGAVSLRQGKEKSELLSSHIGLMTAGKRAACLLMNYQEENGQDQATSYPLIVLSEPVLRC